MAVTHKCDWCGFRGPHTLTNLVNVEFSAPPTQDIWEMDLCYLCAKLLTTGPHRMGSLSRTSREVAFLLNAYREQSIIREDKDEVDH